MRSKTVDRLLKTTPNDVKIFVDLYADLVVRINDLLREKGMSKKELAEKLDKNPSEVSKWLSGEHNFTLRSVAKLQAELGERLLEVPTRKAKTVYETGYSRSVHTFVAIIKNVTQGNSKVIEWQKAKEFKPLKNVG